MSVSLEPDDEALLAAFADEAAPEHETLRSWAQLRGFRTSESLSEGALLRLLARAGAEALREHVLDLAYAQLALEYTAEDHAELRAARDRYVRRTDRLHAG